MNVTIEIPEDRAAGFGKQAQARGLSVDQWFLELAEQEIPGSAEIQTQPDCSGATFFLARTID